MFDWMSKMFERINKRTDNAQGQAKEGNWAGVAGALSTSFGMGQSIAAGIKKKKAEGLEPESVDPMYRMNLYNVQRQAQALRTGVAMSREMDELRKLNQQSGLNAARLSGGAVGAAISGSARIQSSITEALLKLSQQGKGMALQQDALATDIIKNIADRKLGLQMAQQDRLFASAAALQKAGSQNVLASLSSLGSIASDYGVGSTNVADTNAKKDEVDNQSVPTVK